MRIAVWMFSLAFVAGPALDAQADILFHCRRTLLIHDEREREDLGDRLNRDFRLHVTGCVDPAIRGHERYSEDLGIDLASAGI